MSRTYTVYDPATLEPVGEAPQHTAADVDERVRAARAALGGWAADEPARRAALRACAEAIRAESAALGELMSREQGKPRREAEGEFLVGAGMLDYYADLDWEASTRLPDREGRSVRVDRLPVGVVGTITPWNYPISLLLVKLAPALAAGCTVVSKPSPSTPLSTIALVDLMARHLPEGVLQWATSSDRTVNVALAEHPLVRKISFTGSTDVGTRILAQTAPLAKRITMELGGNDPAIVLDDADPAFTGAALAASAFRNAGQVCMAAKRVYVPRSLADQVVESLAAAAEAFVLGRGVEEATTMGPMHNAAQLETVSELVDDALSRGGRRVAGGGRGCDLPGHFMAPTVVTGLDDDAALVSDEQFGAALPVVVYEDLEALVRRLNDQPWGLGASVWSPDLERADAVARTVEAGTVWINQHTRVEQDAPFGGWRLSGVGRERGPWGLEHYQELRTVNAMAHGGAA
ncbi:aldehyde dehydrogenase family protein [Micrococcus sp.]|uniref:aldehyde dehydrogenase family protein n=1 Tax=Micrococcus sp. TaxID=1271 RepID=UPI0026DD4EE8|nr:aldehyde dehydrogenase family protein [Micrococcus sp.]MDO4240615.1 aldehyde dehydrogenase family protein [Micrococcus sp.]